MNVSVYKLKSDKLNGAMYLGFKDGILNNFASELNVPLTDDQWHYLRQRLPLREANINELTQANLKITPVVAKSVQDKVILFCQFYKSYRGVSYVAKQLEKANLKNIPVNKDLLKVFFEDGLQNFTLQNYINRINITKDYLKNGLPGAQATKMPDYYDRDFERKLGREEIQQYHAHLYSKGWVKEYNGTTGTVWKEKKTNL
ncbi:hypothetical protein [Rufibacter quisquiliarum]|uniref:Uncharacterized protein n=1 Tax=Rufibacter quisquiliarum TaxID=1549639 RepID=A0A839GJY5_9BACT|nr:hypothetical protein [Rufibacter quisquiliarum]MBA9078960.1 hypothetical protein [Rufibacter quisquiliarum]